MEKFLDYLQQEEEVERTEFGLAGIDSPIAEPIVAGIRRTFENERDWIDRRLRENRERFREEFRRYHLRR